MHSQREQLGEPPCAVRALRSEYLTAAGPRWWWWLGEFGNDRLHRLMRRRRRRGRAQPAQQRLVGGYACGETSGGSCEAIIGMEQWSALVVEGPCGDRADARDSHFSGFAIGIGCLSQEGARSCVWRLPPHTETEPHKEGAKERLRQGAASCATEGIRGRS